MQNGVLRPEVVSRFSEIGLPDAVIASMPFKALVLEAWAGARCRRGVRADAAGRAVSWPGVGTWQSHGQPPGDGVVVLGERKVLRRGMEVAEAASEPA